MTQLGATAELVVTWSYDGEGKVTAVNYPNGGGAYSFRHDAMGRLQQITEQATATDVASGAVYGPAGELQSLVYYGRSETRQYNSLGQLRRLTVSGAVDIEYRYSATQNNGLITQMKDWVSGEEVNYQYDALNRLASAETTGAGWGQAFGYDGFGNLVS